VISKAENMPEESGLTSDSKVLAADSIAEKAADVINTDTEENEETPPTPTFAFTAKGPDTDITRPLTIEVPVPLSRIDPYAFRLETKPDTVWLPVKNEYRLERADTLSERRFKIEYPWQRGASYRLSIDSLAATDLYGINSDKLEYEFKTKNAEDLSNLKITINGLENGIPAFVQLIASGDKPKYTARVTDGVANFEGIDAGKYYARLYEDFNGDGRYTPGSYRLQKIFGEPSDTVTPENLPLTNMSDREISADSIAYGLTTDSLKHIAAPLDSLTAASTDSIGIYEHGVDSITSPNTVKEPTRFIRPMSDREIVDSLLRIGYSIVPIETDSVGKDILIALQPDYVYYYPKTINVKKNWDMEQTWNVFETALDLQKPDKIKKNKPKRNNNSIQTDEEEDEDEDDEFGANPFDTRRNNTNGRNNRNNRGNNGMRQAF
ncbi:MAG: hypothetical protein K2H22_02550, partial [Muribaculaceae bacterium]|nr:hypothetical protein [Muribaculaceae bacterium]